MISSKPKKVKNKVGRPDFKITPAVCRKAMWFASQGKTELQVAICMGISQATLINKKNDYVEFFEAIKKGQAEAITEVENGLYEDAITPGNTVAKIFFLKNRNPSEWKDKQEVEHSGEVGLSDAIKKARERVSTAEES